MTTVLPRATKLTLLALEFAALFIITPVLLAIFHTRGKFFLPLWVAAVVCLVVLWRDPAFEKESLWKLRPEWIDWRPLFIRLAVCTALASAALLMLAPERFLSFPLTRPLLWSAVIVLYPILSVFPQAVVYRAFLFHRYAPIFPTEWVRQSSAVVAFSLAHVIFGNIWAVLLTLIGGMFFVGTYRRTGSHLAANLEHALYGIMVFTVGWGRYLF